MPGWTVHPTDPDVRIRVVRPMPALPSALEREIDRLWQVAQARTGGGLFNGRVFSADVITPRLICGHWTEFRRIVAQMNWHELFAVLGIRSLAVGGVIHGPDGVVFGRRPGRAVYQAGEWQLPPAGSVDQTAARPEGVVDFVGQVLTELREEVGLPAEAIRRIRPLCIVEHAEDGVGSHVLDFGIGLETGLSAAEIRAAHARDGNAEYAPPLTVVPAAGLAGFLAEAGTLMNLQAPVFLRRLGLLG